MTYLIKNRKQLLSTGNIKARGLSLSIIEAGLSAASPYRATQAMVSLNNNQLKIGDIEYDLNQWENIYIIGGGKATYPIALALEEILGERISDGVVVLKKGQLGQLKHVKIMEGTHPIPDEGGLAGSEAILKIAQKAGEKDIVISCITGGSSALMPMPVDGVSLEEKKIANRLLLSSGANIFEMNAVRKHLSKIKGGRLGLAVFPAQLINLTVSDVIGDALDYITDNTVPDTSTFFDAMATLKKYNLLEKMPKSVCDHIMSARCECESPQTYGDNPCHSFILVGSNATCEAAAQEATAKGLQTMLLSTHFDGESSELGRTFASIGKEIMEFNRPMTPPCIIIGGGETLVTLKDNFGNGGPNQEFVCGALLNLEGRQNFVVAAIDSDGTDGPTDVAGAMADDTTLASTRSQGVDLYGALVSHRVTDSLESSGITIKTGHTGTNVNDLKFMICL